MILISNQYLLWNRKITRDAPWFFSLLNIMNEQQYNRFKAVIEARGYKLCNVPGTIQNESYYYYKGFEYSEDVEDPTPAIR